MTEPEILDTRRTRAELIFKIMLQSCFQERAYVSAGTEVAKSALSIDLVAILKDSLPIEEQLDLESIFGPLGQVNIFENKSPVDVVDEKALYQLLAYGYLYAREEKMSLEMLSGMLHLFLLGVNLFQRPFFQYLKKEQKIRESHHPWIYFLDEALLRLTIIDVECVPLEEKYAPLMIFASTHERKRQVADLLISHQSTLMLYLNYFLTLNQKDSILPEVIRKMTEEQVEFTNEQKKMMLEDMGGLGMAIEVMGGPEKAIEVMGGPEKAIEVISQMLKRKKQERQE